MQFDEGFFVALSKLTERERKDTLLVATEVQQDRRRAGLHVEPLQHKQERNLWSARVNDDIRIILLKNCEALIPMYVGHHEEAYRWANTHRTIRAAQTGSITIVHETAEAAPFFHVALPVRAGLFDNYEDAYLLSLAVPPLLLPALRHVRTEDDLFNLVEDMHRDLADRLLLLADGRLVAPPLQWSPPAPDVIEEAHIPVDITAAIGVEQKESAAIPGEVREPLRLLDVEDADLQRMLDAPMEAWIAFLHPSQRGVAARSFSGAGTGKTVVAMHRARHLARQGRHILLTSFTNNARALLDHGVRLLCDDDERSRILVRTVHALACDLVRQVEVVNVPDEGMIDALIERFGAGCGIDLDVLKAEWQHVIQALAITHWEEYRDARRTGRGTRLTVADRERIWETVIVPVDTELKKRGICDWPDICRWARDLILAGSVTNPFDAVIVDEMQDLGPQELRFLAALAGDGPDCLTLVGDAGQRIYPNQSSLCELGIDVRGRTRTLSLNYRTTAQIYRFAEAILGNEVDDFEGGTERRRTTHSLFTGPEPVTGRFTTPTEQYAAVAARIAARCVGGPPPGEIAILAQSRYLLLAVEKQLGEAGVPCQIVGRDHALSPRHVALATIHRAKGLEFKVVFVIGVSDAAVVRHLPDDPDEQRSALERERNLLYVAATRARDELTIFWTGKPSRFLARVLSG